MALAERAAISGDAVPPGIKNSATVGGRSGAPAGSAEADDRAMRRTGTFMAGLIGTVAVIPGVAAVSAAVVYSVQTTWWPLSLARPYPVLGGTVLVVALWLAYVLAMWATGRTAVHNANVHEYGTLSERARQVQVRLAALADARPGLAGHGGNATGVGEAERLAYAEARAFGDDFERARLRRGVIWVAGTGYVNLWGLVHGAEEALIEVEPAEAVVREALCDQLRLKGSTIQNRDDWLAKLHQAVAVVSASSQDYIDPQLPPAHDVTTAPAPAGSPCRAASTPAEARAVLRAVREAIDTFRDDRRDKLVRACLHLKAAVFVTGLAIYTLLAAEIGYNASIQQVHAVVILALVGTIVGFVGRLNADGGADAAAEDYGLTATHLRQIPVFSGIAAIGGVLLIAGLKGNTGTALGEAYTIDLPNLVTAAVFGLTPGLLIDRIQQRTTAQYKSDLKSTEPTVATIAART